MKIRWTLRSVRLRITPTEMNCLLRGDEIAESLILLGSEGAGWSATLAPAAETSLEIEKGSLRVTLSSADRARLAVPEAEGVYFETGAPPSVRYYVEKDFPCTHPGAPEAGETHGETFSPPGFKERHRTTCK